MLKVSLLAWREVELDQRLPSRRGRRRWVRVLQAKLFQPDTAGLGSGRRSPGLGASFRWDARGLGVWGLLWEVTSAFLARWQELRA